MSNTTNQHIFYSYKGADNVKPSEEILNEYKDKGLIFDENNRTIYANGLEYAGNYDDSELRGRIEELEEKEDKDTVYDDTELRGRIEELEGKEDKDTIYDDAELRGRIEELEGKEDYDDTELRERIEQLEEKEDKDTVYDDTELRNQIKDLEDNKLDKTEFEDALYDINKPTIEYVDLGLPSGLLWATCNLGASKPEEYGLYFQWGDTQGYTGPCSEADSTDDNKETHYFDWSKYKFGTKNNLTKYNSIDNKKVLDPEDDAATVMLGGQWKMPTAEEFQELIDNTDPGDGANTNGWIENYNGTGIKGLLRKSKTNDNTIFFPASGYCDESSLEGVGRGGNCWSSSLYMSSSYYGQILGFVSGVLEVGNGYRCNGIPVRAVTSSTPIEKSPKFATKKSVDDLKDEINERLEELENAEDKDTIYDDSELRGRIEKLEAKEDKDTVYDDTELRGRIEELEGKEDYDDSELRGRIEELEGKEDYDDTELRERIEQLEEAEDKDTVYDDSELRGRIEELEGKEDYDDSELRGRIEELEGKEDYDDSELRERIEQLEEKEDQDTVYDDTDIKERLEKLEQKEDQDTVYDDTDIKERLEKLEQKEDKDTVYDDTDIKERLEKLEQKEDVVYDDTELRERIEQLEEAEDKDTVYDDSELRGRIEELEGKENYDDSELRGRIEELEGKEDYDDSELRGRIEELEGKEDKDTIYDDSELRGKIEELEDALFESSEPTVEYVDLGLPSGLLWATCNLGAEKETDNGLYFQWGDTQGYIGPCSEAQSTEDNKETHYFSTSRYKFFTKDISVDYNKYITTKYCIDPTHGTVDNKTVLDPEDDAATVMLGGQWRMPTVDEYNELLENTVPGDGANSYGWINNYNGTGVNGLLLKSKINDSTIFFPANDGYDMDRLIEEDSPGNQDGKYWTSNLLSVDGSSDSYARNIDCYEWDECKVKNDGRTNGLGIRAVTGPITKSPKFTTKDYVDSEIERSSQELTDEFNEKLDKVIPGSLIASNYGDTFEEALNNCLAEIRKNNKGVTTIDCTNFTGNITCENRFIIDVPCTILLGNAKITMKDTSFFVIKSNGVNIIGLNRQSDMTTDDANATELIMKTISTEHEEGYHIYSRGFKNCSYKNMTLRGIRSSIESQENNTVNPIDGVGGIYIEKANPGKTESGNTCNNITIENVFVYDTKAAAIYMDTPILSTLRQVRITGAGGHGIYINGGTSLLMESCYVASANYAGVCLQGVTYASVSNSCCETCSLGWWIRSCKNVTLISPGVESTTFLKNKPWNTQYNTTKRYGKGLVTKDASGADVKISDVPDDAWMINGSKFTAQNLFIGIAYAITGGKAINILAPYATTIASSAKQNGASLTDILTNLAYVTILGDARSVNIVNFGSNETSSRKTFVEQQLVHEVNIGEGPSNLDFSFDSENTAIQKFEHMTTNVFTERAPIYNEGTNSLIHSGATYYEFINFGDNLTYDDSELRGRIEELESKEDKDTIYDDSELRGRVEELEGKDYETQFATSEDIDNLFN